MLRNGERNDGYLLTYGTHLMIKGVSNPANCMGLVLIIPQQCVTKKQPMQIQQDFRETAWISPAHWSKLQVPQLRNPSTSPNLRPNLRNLQTKHLQKEMH